jgi:methylthioribose-1-phosphate isomerase
MTTMTKELRPLRWNSQNASVEVIDQRLLPHELKWVEINNCKEMAFAIKDMIIRGAPLIGIGAAFGMAMAARDQEDLDAADKMLRETRPTAVNLMWALDECKKVIFEDAHSRPSCSTVDFKVLYNKLLEKATWILQDDIERCKEMSRVGAEYIKEKFFTLNESGKYKRKNQITFNKSTATGSQVQGLQNDEKTKFTNVNESSKNEHNAAIGFQKLRILTHCNAGALATGGYGTALGVIRTLHAEGLVEMVYSDETRPRQQGSKLTAWELAHDGIPVTMISDNMAAHTMKQGLIDFVVVGSDRITVNGDAANKIGTYQVAIVADYHKIPFYVAAPHSTIDMKLASGDLIPIEERDAAELHTINDKLVTAKEGVEFFNPGFDVTPNSLIEAIFTEKGLFNA